MANFTALVMQPSLFNLRATLQYLSRLSRCDETSLSMALQREYYRLTRELPSGLWPGVT
jgi:hypothetical protein